MYLHNLFWISLQDLFQKLGRLFFLSLGVAVGTCALTFLFSLHSGLDKVIVDEVIEKLPFNQIKIRPISQKPQSLTEFFFQKKDESLNLTSEKLGIIEELDGVKDIWPERTLNFPIVFSLKNVQVATFTVPDITMPTTIFGVHPDLVKNYPELHKKFKYNPDPSAEVPILCSSKLFEMMNDTSLAQGQVGDLLSSIVNESTFLDKPMNLKIGFSTRDEKRIQRGFDRAKRREGKLKGKNAGIAKFLRKQFTVAFSAGYETDRPWMNRKGRIIGFTDMVPLVGLSVPLPYVEEWLKIRAEYELDFYTGGVLELSKALPEKENRRSRKIERIKDRIQWIEPPYGIPEQRIEVQSDQRIRMVGNPFKPAPLSALLQSGEDPLELNKPRWFSIPADPNVKELHWNYTLDFPSALYFPSSEEEPERFVPFDLHGIDPALLGDKAELLRYRMKGNDPVPAVVSPEFFARLKEFGIAANHPTLAKNLSALESLKKTELYVVLAYDPEKRSEIKKELTLFKENRLKGKPTYICRKLEIVGVSEQVPEIGISVPQGFLYRAYRWKYPHLKKEKYVYSGVSVQVKPELLKDSQAKANFERKLLNNFRIPVESGQENLRWKSDFLYLRNSFWKSRNFEGFFKIKRPLVQLRGGSFSDLELKKEVKTIYAERTTNFPIQMVLPQNETSATEISLVGLHPSQLQDKKSREALKNSDSFIPVLLSPVLLEKIKEYGVLEKDSPWNFLTETPEKVIGTEFLLTFGSPPNFTNLPTPLKPGTTSPSPKLTLGEAGEIQKLKRTPFTWRAKIVGISPEASPLGLSVPVGKVEKLIKWYYPTQVYNRYSGVTVITKNPKNTAKVTQQIREHPILKLEIETNTETAETLSTMTNYLEKATPLIGFILFLVAAVSIFNGLTLSVLEQSKKIGIYRAIGAKRTDIIFLFMIEAIAVGLIGGGVGVAGGVVLISFVDDIMVQTAPDFACKNIKLWDVNTGRESYTFSGHLSPIYSIALSPDGKIMASGSLGPKIKLWDLTTKSILRNLKGHHSGSKSLVFSKEGDLLFSGSFDKTIKVWSTSTGKEEQSMKTISGSVYSLAVHPEKPFLFAGTHNGTLEIWNYAKKRRELKMKIHDGTVHSLQLSSDGKFLLSAGADHLIKRWSFGPRYRKLFLEQTYKGHTDQVLSLAVAKKGNFFASGSKDHTIRFWDLITGKDLHTFQEHQGAVQDLKFSKDEKYLGSASVDKTIKLWNLKKKKLSKSFAAHDTPVHSLAFLPNGKNLITAGEERIHFFQIKKWYFFFILLFAIIISMVASTLPSIRAAHITPADVLRDI